MISKNYNISSYPTLQNCLFGVVSLTKNVDIDQYKYYGYGMVLDLIDLESSVLVLEDLVEM